MNIFLTDDDSDDCMLFSEALQETFSEATLTITTDGVKLMETLKNLKPDSRVILFLDLNMPRKNGFECLDEIRENKKLKDVSVIIFSTSSNADIIDKTYKQGANYFISKPNSFSLLKKTIEHVLSFNNDQLVQRPMREDYVIHVA
ncbi:MAG: response regulator [Flavobacterium sp. BFFFF1]|uniref:response regulator n=1 Tax=unclassified Flavobacterium TaxID=196869 RepID=UPI000BCE5862|nr:MULTISPECIES: response regulator [unclassified Flavobacterium]OYU81800.1 MAG: response regulator [Flavobacterium sp. BFFFF1]